MLCAVKLDSVDDHAGEVGQSPEWAWLRGSAAGRAWLKVLPRLVSECAEEWELRLGKPFSDAYVSFSVAATLPDETDVVLKVQFPDRDSEHEAAALTHWGGDGAILLLAHDVGRHALLLERCIPGTPLSELEQDEALDVLIGLLPRLWKPAGEPFRPLAEMGEWWADELTAKWKLAGRPFERALLDVTLDALQTLLESQGEQVLLHQDLHARNVLSAEREPWLVIDPKPLAGEPEFGVAAIIRSFDLGHGRQHVEHRLDRLTRELGLARDRARLWALAQTVAWSFGSEFFEWHLRTARWLAEAV
jgi:streptomycin 6-kinase